MTTIELISPLNSEECIDRLKGAVDPLWAIFGKRRVIGRVSQTSLRLRKRIGYGNAFQTFLRAQLEDAGRGTKIHCHFALHPFVRIFMLIWFGGAVLGGGTIFVSTLVAILGGAQIVSSMWMLGVPLMFPLLGYLLLKFGRFLARDEQRFLTDFLRHTIEARDATR